MTLKLKILSFWSISLLFFQISLAQDLSFRNYVHIPSGATEQEIIEIAANLKPSTRQFNWQQLELTAFIHFGMNTFTDKEWGDGTEDPQLFNPSELNAEQWVLTCKYAGFKLIILTAKHHDGFCLWPSQNTEHSVKNTPWKNGQGDVLKELADACHKHNMKLGIYLSPWDRHSPYFGTDEYNDYFVNQLTELLTNYGEISEVWLDGANGEGPNGKQQVYDETRWFATIRKLQPDAVIAIAGPDVRWVGTETGYGKETEWSMRAATFKNRDELDNQLPEEAAFIIESSSPGTLENILQGEHPSLVWYPVEADVSIRPGWFYHPEENEQIKTPDKLFDVYCSSVGRNGVLLLNIPPDTRGLIHEKDIESLIGFNNILKGTFSVNLLDVASVSHLHSVSTQTLKVNPLIIEYILPEAVTFDLLRLKEDIQLGQRIESFKLEYEEGDVWKEITRGTTVGYNRILRFDPVSAKHIRLTIESSRLSPELSEVGLFKQSVSRIDNRTANMEWWHDARFGMFIHWGVYSVFGNIYDGIDVNGEQVHYDKRCSGFPSEWIMNGAKIPRATYREAAKEFDAKDYDPKEWVEIAKNAGMKYIIVTAKHHDGLCLFETQHTDWNAVDASAAQRDLLKDLVEEAKDAGLKIGFYYSQNLDWMHEGGMGNIPEINGEMYSADEVETYVNSIVIPHIQELTANYDIDVFWFDIPGVNNSNVNISQQILDALLDSPVGDKIIYNDRLFTGFNGDFSTPETDTPHIPYNGYSDDKAWEACASLNKSWGFEYEPDNETAYNKNRWKTGYYIVSRLLEIASKGGNFLLNVGPDRHGNIPDPAVNTLQEVGEWMKIYSETIYGAERNSSIHPFEYGYLTQKTENNGSVHWYLHISPSYWEEKEIVVNGITDLPISAVWFDSKKPLTVQLENNNLILSLPDQCPNAYYATIDLHFQTPPIQTTEYALPNNQIRLTPYQATTHHISKDYLPYALTDWYSMLSSVDFNVYLEEGNYTLEAEYASWYQGGELYIKIDDQNYTAYYKNTGDRRIENDINNYISEDLLKELIIPDSKIYSIEIQRNAEIPDIVNWINVRSFIFKKVDASGIENIILPIYPVFVEDGFLVCESPDEQIIKIYDITGRLRKTDTIGISKKVDIRSLETGVYIVKSDNSSQKIVIN